MINKYLKWQPIEWAAKNGRGEIIDWTDGWIVDSYQSDTPEGMIAIVTDRDDELQWFLPIEEIRPKIA